MGCSNEAGLMIIGGPGRAGVPGEGGVQLEQQAGNCCPAVTTGHSPGPSAASLATSQPPPGIITDLVGQVEPR